MGIKTMKIRNIYFGKGVPFFCIAVTLLCIIVTLISQLIPSTYMALVFTYPVKYPWQIITWIFLQGVPQEYIPADFPYSAMQLTIGHLGYNLLLILPFGILVEKVLGTKKMLVLFAASWVADVILFLVTGAIYTSFNLLKDGEQFGGSGASGLAFCFTPTVVYALLVLGRNFGFGKLLKQVSFYFLISIAIQTLIIALSPSVKGVTGIPSMIIHLLALVIGIIFTIVFRKSINAYFDIKQTGTV